MEANSKNRENAASPNQISQEEVVASVANLAKYESKSPSNAPNHIQPSTPENHNNFSGTSGKQMENGQGDDLKRSAGEFLNGIHRNVEVQIVHPISSNNFQAYALLDSGEQIYLLYCNRAIDKI